MTSTSRAAGRSASTLNLLQHGADLETFEQVAAHAAEFDRRHNGPSACASGEAASRASIVVHLGGIARHEHARQAHRGNGDGAGRSARARSRPRQPAKSKARTRRPIWARATHRSCRPAADARAPGVSRTVRSTARAGGATRVRAVAIPMAAASAMAVSTAAWTGRESLMSVMAMPRLLGANACRGRARRPGRDRPCGTAWQATGCRCWCRPARCRCTRT